MGSWGVRTHDNNNHWLNSDKLIHISNHSTTHFTVLMPKQSNIKEVSSQKSLNLTRHFHSASVQMLDWNIAVRNTNLWLSRTSEDIEIPYINKFTTICQKFGGSPGLSSGNMVAAQASQSEKTIGKAASQPGDRHYRMVTFLCASNHIIVKDNCLWSNVGSPRSTSSWWNWTMQYRHNVPKEIYNYNCFISK